MTAALLAQSGSAIGASSSPPVDFTSIDSGSECKLNGSYGWYENIGYVAGFISHTVSDCDIPDGAVVLTWSAFPTQAFYCTIKFDQALPTAESSAELVTLNGRGVDISSEDWNSVPPSQWCYLSDECERPSISRW